MSEINGPRNRHGTAVGRIQSSCDFVLLSWASLAWDLHLLCRRFAWQSQCQVSIELRSRPSPPPTQKDEHSLVLVLAEDMGLEEVRSVQTLKFQGGEHVVHVCTQDCTQNQNWFSRYCSRSDVFIRSTGSFQSDPNISLALSILFRIVLICTNIASAVTEKFILFSR